MRQLRSTQQTLNSAKFLYCIVLCYSYCYYIVFFICSRWVRASRSACAHTCCSDAEDGASVPISLEWVPTCFKQFRGQRNLLDLEMISGEAELLFRGPHRVVDVARKAVEEEP